MSYWLAVVRDRSTSTRGRGAAAEPGTTGRLRAWLRSRSSDEQFASDSEHQPSLPSSLPPSSSSPPIRQSTLSSPQPSLSPLSSPSAVSLSL